MPYPKQYTSKEVKAMKHKPKPTKQKQYKPSDRLGVKGY